MQTLSAQANQAYFQSIHGIELRRFLNIEQLNPVADALGHPLSDAERRLLVDFEHDEKGNVIEHRCAKCNGTFYSVSWKLPVMGGKWFLENLTKSKKLQEMLEWYKLPIFGCHYYEGGKILSYCGSAFPGWDGVQGGYEQSCLREKATDRERLHVRDAVWGMGYQIALEMKNKHDRKEEEKSAERELRRIRRIADRNAQKRQEEVAMRRQERELALV